MDSLGNLISEEKVFEPVPFYEQELDYPEEVGYLNEDGNWVVMEKILIDTSWFDDLRTCNVCSEGFYMDPSQ